MNKTPILLALAALFVLGACKGAPSSSPEGEFPIKLFTAGELGVNTYRIPAIVAAKDGTLLAFCEARTKSHKDDGDIDLVVKRSTDGGLTWSESIMIWDDRDQCCSSPNPVVLSSGRILVAAGWKNMTTKLLYVQRKVVFFSDDNGLTWSAPHDITDQISDQAWLMNAIGPVHGIQLSQGPHKGRVVLPCYFKWLDDYRVWHGRSYLIYSDDEGMNWHRGAYGTYGGNECTVAELSNGDIMLNMREFKRFADDTTYLAHRRLVAISPDGGETLTPCTYDWGLKEPVCQGSLLRYMKGHRNDDWLLFSNSDSEKARENLTVKLSKNGGKTWKVIYREPYRWGAYSDMAELPDGSVAIIYEAGEKNSREFLAFDIIPASAIK